MLKVPTGTGSHYGRIITPLAVLLFDIQFESTTTAKTTAVEATATTAFVQNNNTDDSRYLDFDYLK